MFTTVDGLCAVASSSGEAASFFFFVHFSPALFPIECRNPLRHSLRRRDVSIPWRAERQGGASLTLLLIVLASRGYIGENIPKSNSGLLLLGFLSFMIA